MASKRVDQPTAMPTRKMMAVGAGAALSVITIYLIETVLSHSMSSIIAALFAAGVSFSSGYVVRESVSILSEQDPHD